ncbi:MAG TPA: hypothetical protein VIF62_28700 [Labilithrix sp.]
MGLLRAATALVLASLAACAANTEDTSTVGDDVVVGVPQTDVERQSIGLSWLWSYGDWVKTMHGGTDLTPSPTYWAYWHWFDQIANGYGDTIATGGNWATANSIVSKYGLADDATFLAGGDPDPVKREQAALAAINASLASGPLSSTVTRRDRLAVRRELDRAWGLSPDVSSALDAVFGDHVVRTFLPTSQVPDTSGTFVLRAEDVPVSYRTAPMAAAAQKSLANAMHEWRNVYFAAAQSDAYLARVQAAVNDGQPVLLTWFVDFDALEVRDNGRLGSFNLSTLNELGPGVQGGHTVVIQAVTTDGSSRLQALRVPNAWGAAHPDRAFMPGVPNEHDLWLDYLASPIKRCVERDGSTDTSSCPYTQVPLQDVVLPPGY